MLRSLFAFLLTTALLMPSGLRAYHALAEHLDTRCENDCKEDPETHIHTREFHCGFDHFVLSPFQIALAEYTTGTFPNHYYSEPAQPESPYAFRFPGCKMLRAPPPAGLFLLV